MSKKSEFFQHLAYFSVRIFFFPLSLLPYSVIHRLGQFFGNLAYFLGPSKFRKTTYHNLALAKNLKLSEKQLKKIARLSFQNLVIVGLEYFRLKASRKKMDQVIQGYNLKPLSDQAQSGQGSVAVTGHIANWELCFLHFTQMFKASAIGKPIKNGRLYRFIRSIREMHGGKIVEMQDALSKGIKQIKEGDIFAMVNDQSFTSSFYSYPFFGSRAWTSPSPALLAYKAEVPIFVVTTTRLKKGKYEYRISDPIWPNRKNPLKVELPRLMDEIMNHFEKHITKHPDQWLWQHKRWKQEGFHRVYNQFKADSILFILPQDEALFDRINIGLPILSQIYTRSFLTFMVPLKYKEKFSMSDNECLYYQHERELFVRDYRFQLVFDFEENPKIKKHFLKLSAFKVYTLSDLLRTISLKKESPFNSQELFMSTLCLSDTPFN
jgi:KDO2-lipid IV(A) lauroyltransferase